MPTYSITQAAGPLNTAAATKPKGVRLSCDVKNDEDVTGFHPWFSEFLFKRYTSSGNAAADTNGIVVYQGPNASHLDSSELTKTTAYWYGFYWIDIYGNVSAAGTVRSVNYRGATYSDADNEVLSAPTGASLSQANRDIDLDGTVDIALLATFSGGSANAKDYEFECSSATSSGGTYTVIETRRSPSGKAWFAANTQLFYKMRVRPIAWDDTPGSWTSLVGPVQPSGTVGAPAAPVGVTVGGLDYGFLVDWNLPAELDYDFTEIAVGTASVVSGVISTSKSTEAYVYLPGSGNPYVYVRHVNTSGLQSAWTRSSASISPKSVQIAKDTINTTSSGSVSVDGSTGVLLALSWICTSNTSNVSINLGSKNFVVDFVNGQGMTLSWVDVGTGPTFSASKGSGSWKDCVLCAVAI